jgi:hypothetical protein
MHWNQKIFPQVSSATSSLAAPRSATKNGERKYLLYINWLIEGLRSPQIWPHLPVLVLCSLLRYAAPAIQIKSIPAMPKRNSGTGFLAAEMKEYDA